jgi:hypothetical protein
MYQTEADLREDRQRRWLYLLFGISMIVSATVCAVILFFTITPPQGKRLVGKQIDFAPGRVTEKAVKRLELTQLLPNSPNWSDDIVFVIRQPNDTYVAFLGLDPMSGCKLNWQTQEQRFFDACTQTSYNIAGSNMDQVTTLSTRPNRMIELPVETTEGDVYVIDRILRRDRQ